jgi:uncharacterized protein YdhG (YjbR/CyaY superfamily)
MRPSAGTVTAYLDSLGEAHRRALSQLRSMIEKAAPKAKASMKLGLPSWELAGPLFALASRPRAMELYVAEPDLVRKRKRALGDVTVGTTSVRFARLEDLDLDEVAALLAEAAGRRTGGPTASRA